MYKWQWDLVQSEAAALIKAEALEEEWTELTGEPVQESLAAWLRRDPIKLTRSGASEPQRRKMQALRHETQGR